MLNLDFEKELNFKKFLPFNFSTKARVVTRVGFATKGITIKIRIAKNFEQ
jgi:hypothetical protein